MVQFFVIECSNVSLTELHRFCFSPSALSSAAEVRTACSGADPTRPTSPARNPVKVSEVKTRPTTSTTMASASSSSSTQAPSSIVNKPARGWLHPDYLFAKDGINYNVRVSYDGCCFGIRDLDQTFVNGARWIFVRHPRPFLLCEIFFRKSQRVFFPNYLRNSSHSYLWRLYN